MATELEANDPAIRFLRLARSELDRSYRVAGLILGNRLDAQDATQDALLRAWRAAATLRDPTGFQAWFDRILINVCRDRLRRRGRVRFVPLDGIAGPEGERDPFREVLDRDEVLGALDGLEAEERTVIVLRYWADLTLPAIAERTGWPLGTVKSRLHRAVGRMHANLEHAATAIEGGRP